LLVEAIIDNTSDAGHVLGRNQSEVAETRDVFRRLLLAAPTKNAVSKTNGQHFVT